MKKTVLSANVSQIGVPAVRIAVGMTITTLTLLAGLHVLSPESDPSWGMVSEYANGEFPWVLSLMFASWAISSWALAYGLKSQMVSKGGKVGLGFLILAGVGQAMASVFDINHPLQDMAGNIGIGSFVVAASLMGSALARTKGWMDARKPLLWASHATWISLVLLVVTFVLLISTYMQSGADMTATSAEVTSIPDGVIALVGWTNRLLVVVFCAWVLTVGRQAMKLR